MALMLIDVVLDFWARQDEAKIERWALFLCGKNKLPYYDKSRKYGHGHKSAVTTEEEAREMFGFFTVAGNYIGVAGGEISGGIFAFDIDVKNKNLPESLRTPEAIEFWIKENYGDLPHTAIQTTKSGGRHRIYFDPEINSQNNVFDGDATKIFCDVKGNGGYFILYDFNIDFDAITEAPEWIKTHLETQRKRSPENKLDFGDIFSEGNRNAGLTRIAGKFWLYGDSPPIFSSLMYGYNLQYCSPPLPIEEVDKIIKSALENFNRDFEKTEIETKINDFENLADFLVPIEPESFVLEKMMIEGGINMFTGSSGSGKTWAATDLCISIAQGSKWLGKKTIQKNVFIIDEESGKKRLIRRFSKLAIGRGIKDLLSGIANDADKIPISAQTIRRTDISKSTFVSTMKDKIISEDIGFILIDALVDVTPGAKENDAKEMLPSLLNLKQLCEETGVTILVIHHAGKSAESNSRGTSAIEGAVDAMFKLTQKKPGIIKIESVKERDIARIEIGAKIVFSDYSVFLEESELDEEPQSKKMKKFKIDILAYVFKNPDCPTHEVVANVFGSTAKTISNELHVFCKEGYLDKSPVGNNPKLGNKWRISEEKKHEVSIITNPGYSFSGAGNLEDVL